MESRKLLFSVISLFVMITDFQVQAMTKVNTEFERYLQAMNSTTTVPKIEERIVMDNFILAFLNYSYINNKGENVTCSDDKENARYGEGQIFNVTGQLVHVSHRSDVYDDKACDDEILGTQGDPFPTDEPWIALVRRGKCNFEDKVRRVAQRGAVGVIIFNDKPVTSLEKMQIMDKDRNITAVLTYQEIGEDMATILDQGFKVVASISRGRSGDRPLGVMNEASMLFVSISFIVLLIITVVWLLFYYIQRFRYIQSKDKQSRHLCTVTKRAIMKIPTKTGRGIDKDGDNDCCAVCIETYKSSDCIRILPCKHEFHKNCIDPWLIEHRTCPMCKLDVLKYYGYVVGEPSSTVSPANERIITANNHTIVNSSNVNSSNFENRNNNSSSNSNNGSYPVNLIVISHSIPTDIDTHTTPIISDTRINVSSSTESSSDAVNSTTTSTASRQVTDV